MEQRLIDANALKASLKPLTCGKARNQSYRYGLNTGLHDFFPQIIDKAPTVDPVKYGHWVEHRYGTTLDPDCVQFYCSECNGVVEDCKTNFCPNCGARMDKNQTPPGNL